MGTWGESARRWVVELRRRRVVRTLLGYVVAAWVLLQVGDVVFEPLGLDPLAGKRWLILGAIAGIAPVAILAWVFDVRGRRVVRTAPVAVPAASAPFSSIASIAILPFADLSAQQDQAWFCDGLAEEIIDALCCVRGLRVASRTASFRYRDGSVDPREIGRQLLVGAILEGSVRKAGEDLRVTAQLIDADTGFHLWSQRYDRRLEDVFAIQTEIAREVGRALEVSLAGPALGRAERYAPRSVAAYEYYLRGRQMLGDISADHLRQAPHLFRRAIELDPQYAQAHAALADALAQSLLWRFPGADESLPEASAAASRALDLAPDLAEAHVAQGHLRSLAGDADGARRSFERAIALNPELHEAFHYFARHLSAQGEHARAAAMFAEAFRTRNDDFVPLALGSNQLDANGDTTGGEAMARRAREGLKQQAEREPGNPRLHYLAAGLDVRLGDIEAGRARIETALRLAPDDYSTLYNAACFHARVGEHERALGILESIEGGNLAWFEHDPDFASLREAPRFKAILARLAG